MKTKKPGIYRTHIFFVLLVIGLFFIFVGAQETQPNVEGALQQRLDEQVEAQDILGMATAVHLPDGTVIGKSAGYLDPEGKNVWTMDTQSALGSITKTFTAVVIMQLVEEGKLALDDTICT